MKADTLSPLNSFRIFFRDFAEYAGISGIITLLLVVVGGVLEGAGLLLLVPLLGIATDKAGKTAGYIAPLTEHFGAFSQFEKLAILVGILGAIMLMRAAILVARDMRLAKLQVGFVEQQRARVVDRLAGTSWKNIAALRHSRIAHLMSGDIQRIGASALLLTRSLSAVIFLTVQCALAFMLSPQLTCAVLVILTASGFAGYAMLQRSRQFGLYATEANLGLLDTTMQFLGGLKIAISQNAQPSFADAFKRNLATLAYRQISFSQQTAIASAASTTLAFLIGATAVLVGFGVLHLDAAVLVTMLLVISRMNGPAFQLQQSFQQIANFLPAYEKLTELIAELEKGKPEKNASLPAAMGNIIFSKVAYHYEAGGHESSRGVTDLCLYIPQSRIIGIAGPSGSGKTTFADLLAGLYAPQRGSILIDGNPLLPEMLPSWRTLTSYVTQDAFMFHESIRYNLAWANPKATEKEMRDALAITEAAELVERMPHGLDTIMGERGTSVSGGERQRIALSRAILRYPQLLILDEATSGLDIEMEKRVIERLRKLPQQPTIILITHRTECLKYCDAIIRFGAGRAYEEIFKSEPEPFASRPAASKQNATNPDAPSGHALNPTPVQIGL